MMIGKLVVTIVAIGSVLAACDSTSGGGGGDARVGGLVGASPSASRPVAATPTNPSPGMAPGAPPGLGAGGRWR